MNGSVLGSEFLGEIQTHIFERIDFRLPDTLKETEITGLINSSVLADGKRFRPLLLLLFGRMIGLDFERLAPYARIVEMTHAATLIHDDVIDEADQRRTRKTLNAELSNPHAILAGDFLLAHVISEVSALGDLRILGDLASVLRELVQGEWRQLQGRNSFGIDRAHLDFVAEKKTASLMAWCCTTPLRLLDAKPALIEAARHFGTHLGVAFQRMDDLLDFQDGTGKPYAQDFREGLINFVTFELLEHQAEKRSLILKSLGTEGPYPWSQEELSIAIESVKSQVVERVNAARKSLEEIGQLAPKEGLSIHQQAYDSLLDLLEMSSQRSY